MTKVVCLSTSVAPKPNPFGRNPTLSFLIEPNADGNCKQKVNNTDSDNR
jgi:hypothetical protein